MSQRDFSFVFVIVLISTPCLFAQEVTFQIAPGGTQPIIVGPDGKPMALPGGIVIPKGAIPPTGKTTPPKKADDKSKKKTDDDKSKKKKEPESKVLTRPDKPPMPANPDELNVRPDGGGLIKFNFRYQLWPDVLDWLATISQMSLDWQELPKDFLNLTTQREYTVVETRDLINRHLLARGFTLLENGDVLSVVAVAKLNPAMVPRFQADDLDQLADKEPYKFVKVSFALDWMLASEAAEEFKPMLSPNGKLVPLTHTNRLEGMDTAINLREINALLRQEQSTNGESPLVEEFVLNHARASDVLTELETLLGLQSKKAPTVPMSSSQMRALQQQQLAQQMAQRGGQKAPTAAKKESPVHLVVNKRKNSILAHAPPDKMAIIAQAIRALDVRPQRYDSLLAKRNQVEIYRLNNLDPTALARTLEDLGDLEPTTRLDVDEKNNALIVYGSLVDQATIRQLIQRLDGNSRHFEVVRLRRLAADYVAGTVEFMMVGDQEKNEQPRYYDLFMGGYGSSRKKTTNGDKFRVDADVQGNMLLLWANDQEIESVMQLLVKLGELPPQGGNPDKVRVLTTIAPEDAAEFLENLQRAWRSLSPNTLNLPELAPANEPTPGKQESDRPNPSLPGASKEVHTAPSQTRSQLLEVALRSAAGTTANADDPRAANSAAVNDPETSASAVHDSTRQTKADETVDTPPGLPSTGTPAVSPETASPKTEPASPAVPTDPSNEELLKRFFAQREQNQKNTTPSPINLSFAPDGSLVISSEDTAALDVLEELIRQTAPPLPDYKIYKLKYADAYWVMDNIEEFFEEDEDDDNGGFNPFYFGFPSPKKSQSRSRLSQRRKLKFIYDLDTNSILVQGANSQQLKTIEDLIEVYDQPEPTNSQSARVSTVFPIRHSKASIVAAAIKDVYRDLLSSNDKALQSNNPERKNRESREPTFIFGSSSSGEPERTQVTFKGKLSIGIDDVSNTLLVSTEGENLMKIIGDMINSLDEAAKPLSSFSVVHLSGSTNAARVREVLANLFTEGKSSASPGAAKNVNAPQKGQNGRPGQAQEIIQPGGAVIVSPR